MSEHSRPTPEQVIMGWLWAYSALRKVFDKSEALDVATDLAVRLRLHGYEIGLCRMDDGGGA